jgi:hypothetical protein
MKKSSIFLLLTGDLLALLLVTLFGFQTHETLGTAGWRIFSTFIPLCVAWGLIGYPVGVFRLADASNPRRLWLPVWGMVLAAPMAGWLRGLWLQQPVIPIFVIVIGGFSAVGLLLWRALFLGLQRWMK